MHLVFIDEQYGRDERGRYTAVLAAIFDERIIQDYRIEFVQGLVDTLNLNANGYIIHTQLPILHGSDMLREYEDEKKLEVFNLLCRLVKKYNVSVLRLGYYDESIPFISENRKYERISFCVTCLDFRLRGFFK